MYAYGSNIYIPYRLAWNGSNYWVDVVFVAAGQPTSLQSIEDVLDELDNSRHAGNYERYSLGDSWVEVLFRRTRIRKWSPLL